MTREELEAAIWQALTRLANLGQDGPDTVAEILRAADAYATAEVGLLTPAERRRVLFEAGS